MKFEHIIAAATHDTSYQNDAGGVKPSRRWLSEATPSGYEMGVKAAGTPVGVQDLMPSCRPVVSSLKRSSTTGYRLRCLRHRRDQKVSLMVAKSLTLRWLCGQENGSMGCSSNHFRPELVPDWLRMWLVFEVFWEAFGPPLGV